jgi:hypothetical protein
MHNGQSVARVYGTVRQVQPPYDGTYPPNFDEPLPQVTGHLESSKKKVATKTADDGSFAVYDLPSGTYTITAALPADVELAQTILSDPPPPLQLDTGSCVERDVNVLPTGKIRGQLLGSDGKPLWNAPVELFSVDRYKEDTRGWWELVDDKKKYFEFETCGARRIPSRFQHEQPSRHRCSLSPHVLPRCAGPAAGRTHSRRPG